MYEMTKGGREYCVCDECNKPYSFKSANGGAIGMMRLYCREHGQQFWPPLPSKKVDRMVKRIRRGEA